MNNHFAELTARPKFVKFFTLFAYEAPPKVLWSYGSVIIPGLDLSATYNYRYQWRRLTVEPRVGLSVFVQGYNGDTSRFISALGDSEWTIGYYGNNIKLGYTGGLNVRYRLFGPLSLGLDAQYLSPFRNNYNYIYRERYRGSSHNPDMKYGLKMNNLYAGFRIQIDLNKRKKEKRF